MKLATGEEFFGDPLTLTQKLAEAKVHAQAWAWKKIQEAQQQYQQQYQQPAQQPIQVEQPQTGLVVIGELPSHLEARTKALLADDPNPGKD